MVRLSRLKQLRQRRALSQVELAERAGVDRSTISRLETDAKGAFPATVRKLAAALGAEPEDLLDPTQTLAADRSHRVPGGTQPGLPQHLQSTDEARRFLDRNPELTRLLRQAVEQLRRYFPDGRMHLQLLPDPEYGEPDQLLLEVSTGLEEVAALEVLARFDEEWWFHHIRHSDGALVIDLAPE